MPRLRVFIVGAYTSRGRHECFIKEALERRGALVSGIHPNRCRWLYHRGPKLFPRLFRARVRSFEPDLLLTTNGRGLTPELWESVPGIKAMWYVDYRDPPDPHVINLAKVSDHLFITSEGQIQTYRSLGVAKVSFLPQGVAPEMKALSRPFEFDVSFFGSGYADRHRLDVLLAFRRRFEFHIFGHNWDSYYCPFVPHRCLPLREWREKVRELRPVHPPVYNEDLGDRIARSRVVLGVAQPDVMLYFSNRIWFTLGWGGFLLQEYPEGFERLFENRRHLVWFRSVEEGLDLAAKYLRDDWLRRRIAFEGYRYVHEHHTYDERVDRLLRICGLD